MNARAERLQEVFQAQQATALAWRSSRASERVDRIRRLLHEIQAQRTRMLDAAAADFHRPATEVMLTEMVAIAGEARTAMRNTTKWMRPRYRRPTLVGFGTAARVRMQPRGRALILSPWNYPFVLSFAPLISALAAGCPVVLKPSEISPAQSSIIADIVARTFPLEEVAVAEGDVQVAQRLLDLPFDHMFFTGSPAVGRLVMAAAARHLSSVTLELGGKSPVIVDASADLDQAARITVAAKFMNFGQTCVAPDHVYVDASVHDAFVQRCKTWLARIYGASVQEQQANENLARISSPRHFDRLAGLLDDAVAAGAQVATGGIADRASRFLSPTILTRVPADAQLMQEEIFGPILPVIAYGALGQAIEAINAGPKPLALYVWTANTTVAERVLAQTSSGGACVNHCLIQFAHGNVPFGGVNGSGIGNSHGYWGFLAFSHERAVIRNRIMIADKLLPPYNRLKRRAIEFLAR